MRKLPVAAQLYVSVVIATGLALLVVRFPVSGFDAPILFCVLAGLSAVSAVFKVRLPLTKDYSTFSLSHAVDFLALLLLGANQTMLIAAASAWSQATFRTKTRAAVHRTVFSMSVLVIAVQAVGLVYQQLGGVAGQPSAAVLALSVVPLATVYFLLNAGLVATAIALSGRERIWKVWNDNFLWSGPSYFIAAGTAAVAAMVIPSSAYWLVPLVAVPIYLTYRAYKIYMGRIQAEMHHVEQVSDLHLATVEALARAIDAKDQMSPDHLHRVQVYAAGLAQVLDLPDEEIQGIKTAALLHDIGKLAVPEYILSKPGRLTAEEFERIRSHPQVGADIIDVVPFPYPVAPLIRSHHERWDGSGYPRGLKGGEIPVGARILAVVDYFDALMSERPYHKPISAEDAIGVLRREAGQALDPELVQTFFDILPSLRAADAKVDQACRRKPHLTTVSSRSRPAASGTSGREEEATVFDDIASTHKEIYALYEIAQAMGKSLGVPETMGLISSKVTKLVPFSACALFLQDGDSELLECRFASGTDAKLLRNLAVPLGQGTNGVVARNQTSVLNASPIADLEAAGVESPEPMRLQSALVCPLTLDGRFIGTLAVYHEEADFYLAEHQRLLERVAGQAAAVINNSIVFEQTQVDSLTDPLTGLPNRRSLFMHLTNELSRAKRLGTQVSVLVIDLDDFKTINDEHGHEVGDRALCAVGQKLRSEIRPYDICVRYAGDEFVVVLSGVSGVELLNRQEQLRKAIETVLFEPSPGVQLPLGVSVGEAAFPHDGETYDVLFETADRRMYEDKSSRKRVKSARDGGGSGNGPANRAPSKPALTVHQGGKAG